MKKRVRKIWIAILALVVLVLLIFLYFHFSTTGYAIGLGGRCSIENSLTCPGNKVPPAGYTGECCLKGENCLSYSTFGRSTKYICCPPGYSAAQVSVPLGMTVVYCKQNCQNPTPQECVQTCCAQGQCYENTGWGQGIYGQCRPNKQCDTANGETQCDNLCCNANQTCMDVHYKGAVISHLCTQSQPCSGSTPDICTGTNSVTGDTYSICCPSGQCQHNLGSSMGTPYCYSGKPGPTPTATKAPTASANIKVQPSQNIFQTLISKIQSLF